MNSELLEFFHNLKDKVGQTQLSSKEFDDFEKIPILKTQCLYVYDYNRNKITYCKNTLLLGHNEDDFTLEKALNYHPDDKVIINTVTQSAIKYGVEENMFEHDCCFSLTFRLKKKDGTYLQVLKQSTIYCLDEEGRMGTNITILSDISFIHTPGFVNWSFKLNNLDSELFENAICGGVRGLFLIKELELLPYFIKGETSRNISEKLFISKLTVDTHRRNIKSKSGCNNMYELMIFASRNKLV